MASPLFAILQSINHVLEDGSPGEIRTLVGGSKAHYAWPLHHRAARFQITLALFIVRGFKVAFLAIRVLLMDFEINLSFRFCKNYE